MTLAREDTSSKPLENNQFFSSNLFRMADSSSRKSNAEMVKNDMVSDFDDE